ncbi:MaoC-like dehydratase [plant metagenome]|uniref:MaoC-like dehydratase n=1 Tax=plant metagenome TaxID=1297885 RepID=A0A484SF24_9ZZZZ
MSEEEIKRFARDYDPQPFHLDDEAAKQTFFRGLAASGWHTAAITMRLLVKGGLPLADGIIGMGGEIAWLAPVRPGDVLRVTSTVAEIAPSQSKPDRAVVRFQCSTVNQRDEVVQRIEPKLLVFKRPA